jgi:LPS sulfotransferase NodH
MAARIGKGVELSLGFGVFIKRIFSRLKGQPDPFAGITPDPARQARILARPAPRLTYGIMFTPRSGSSRVTDILTATGALGLPREHFNPNFLPGLAKSFESPEITTYCAAVKRLRTAGEVYGCELTHAHLKRAFDSHAQAQALLAPDRWFWLIREDIVAQAVSLSRMVQLRVSHDVGQVDEAARAAADAAFAYDAADIARRLNALRKLENGSEAFFAEIGVAPVRLSYERLSAMDPAAVAALFARHLGVTLPPDTQATSTHRKLGTDKNDAYAVRFRKEKASLVAKAEAARAPLLAALAAQPE